MSEAALRVALTSRYDIALAGGIESCVAALVPRLQRARPSWRVRAVHAFGSRSLPSRVPFLCDVLAGIVLAWRTRADDVVIVNGAEYAFVRALIPGWRRATIVVWHGTRAGEIPALAPRMTLPIRIYAWLERALQRVAYAIPRHLAVGDTVRGELVDAYGSAPQLLVVPNGAPPAGATRSTARDGTVLWIGTSAYKKGLDLALAACRHARRSIPDLELTIVGLPDAPAAAEPWVIDRGVVPHAQMDAVYDAAAVVLASTRYEACSMAMLESMARGKAIVPSVAVAWMLGEPGARDVRELGEALVRACRPAERARLEARSRASLSRFDWEAAVDAYARAVAAMAAA